MHPKRFREELKRFDRRLDFVWDGGKSQWEVIGFDRKGIRYLIQSVPLGKLDQLGPHIIQGLYENSPHKQGGAKALNRLMDEQIEKEEEQEERHTRESLDFAASEAYDAFKRRTGARINNAGVPYIVNDRRRIKPDALVSVGAEKGGSDVKS